MRSSETAEAVATLSIGGYAEQVAVRAQPETFVPPTADGQVETLSPKEIDQLPDDPDELAIAIEALAGVGAEIRVNGFEGGVLPPKNQIQVVRIRRDPFSTDSMGAGQVRVEIITRPGGTNWTHEVDRGLPRPVARCASAVLANPAGGPDASPQLELQRSHREGPIVGVGPVLGARLVRRAANHRDRRPDDLPGSREHRAAAFRRGAQGRACPQRHADPARRVPALGLRGRQPRRGGVRAARARLQRRQPRATSPACRPSAPSAGTS